MKRAWVMTWAALEWNCCKNGIEVANVSPTIPLRTGGWETGPQEPLVHRRCYSELTATMLSRFLFSFLRASSLVESCRLAAG